MSPTPIRTPSRRARHAFVVGAVLSLALAGCAKGENQPAAQAGSGPAASAAAEQAGGPTCTLSQTGYPKVDLTSAIVGFSQSEKEGNPFRIAETQSIRDEAAKLGIPTNHLLTTNAQSDLNKQISDIKSLLAQGAQLLIVAPLNSDGLQPALDAAKAKQVPVVTIDRKVTSQPCSDYLTFIGSDFISQGKRAADGTGKIAILLGSSGNNVTTDRTKGFKDELAARSPPRTCSPVLATLVEAAPFERATLMAPDDGSPSPVLERYQQTLGLDVPVDVVGREQFRIACRSPDLAATVATADERHYANILLTVGALAKPGGSRRPHPTGI